MPYFQGIHSVEDFEQYFKVLKFESGQESATGVYVDFRNGGWYRARLGTFPLGEVRRNAILGLEFDVGACLRITPMPSDLGAFTNWSVNLLDSRSFEDRSLIAQMNSVSESGIFR